MQPRQRWTCATRRATGLKHCGATDGASSACGSTISGESAFAGMTATPSMSRSWTITEATMKLLRNPHPGEILRTEFLDESGLSQNALAAAIGVPPNRVHAIVKGT